MTAFDVVEPSMIPKLYEIFLIALQPIDTDPSETVSSRIETEDQKEDIKYASLTVPCKNHSYYITVSQKSFVLKLSLFILSYL